MALASLSDARLQLLHTDAVEEWRLQTDDIVVVRGGAARQVPGGVLHGCCGAPGNSEIICTAAEQRSERTGRQTRGGSRWLVQPSTRTQAGVGRKWGMRRWRRVGISARC